MREILRTDALKQVSPLYFDDALRRKPIPVGSNSRHSLFVFSECLQECFCAPVEIQNLVQDDDFTLLAELVALDLDMNPTRSTETGRLSADLKLWTPRYRGISTTINRGAGVLGHIDTYSIAPHYRVEEY